MLDKVSNNIDHFTQFDLLRPLLVGVSGGPDSLCLLDALRRLNYSLVIAHFNHGLRLKASEEAQRVRELSISLDIPYVEGKAQVDEHASINRLSIEESARHLRYQFLFEQAIAYDAQAVVVGHTADDQVETVLMHLLRGSGLTGLRGMDFYTLPNNWSLTIPLFRPLLSIWREEILKYLQECDLQPIFDESNLSNKFFRNRLRNELIPFIETYNPQIKRILWNTTNILGNDEAVLSELTNTAWQTCLVEQGCGWINFNNDELRALPLAIQRRILRKGIAQLQPGLRNVDYKTIERGCKALDMFDGSICIDLIAGLQLVIEINNCWIKTIDAEIPFTHWPQLLSVCESFLSIPGTINVSDRWQLDAQVFNCDQVDRNIVFNNLDPYLAWSDREKMEEPIIVRRRVTGDRIQPLGMVGKYAKLSDVMVNLKIPERARASWPLVCSKKSIIWMPGFRIAHQYRVTAETKQLVLFRLFNGKQKKGE